MGDRASAGLIEQKEQLFNKRHQVADLIQRHIETIKKQEPVAFCKIIKKKKEAQKSDYLSVIANLQPEERSVGTKWLQDIVEEVEKELLEVFSTIQ